MFRYIAPLRRSYRTTGVAPYFLVTRAEEGTSADGTTMTTASVNISGDGSILTVFHGVGAGSANTPTVSGWTLMNAVGDTRAVATFYRAGGFSGTATIDWGGQTQTFRGYCFVDAYGYDFSDLEVQEDSLSHTSSTVTSTAGDPLALATFDEADNTVYLAIMHGGSTPNLATFDAGMETLQNRDISAESISLGVAWNDAQDLQPDASWANTGHYVTHAFELRKTAASGVVEGEGTISAIGDVSATGAKHAEGTSSVSAVGTASATGAEHSEAVAAISAIGATSATGQKHAEGTAAVSAIGTCTATGQEHFAVTASISAIGTVTATGVKRAESAATISAVGTCTATGSALEGAGGAGSIAAIGALTVTGRKHARASVTLSCIGTATLLAQADRTAVVVLAGLGALVGIASKHTSGVAAITGIGVLTAGGTTVPDAAPPRGPTDVSVYPSRTSILIG